MAARSYKRDSRGRFGGSASRGDRAETIQQNRAKKKKTARDAKDKLSGSRLGGSGKSARSQSKSKVRGAKVTKAARNARAKSRKRFG